MTRTDKKSYKSWFYYKKPNYYINKCCKKATDEEKANIL